MARGTRLAAVVHWVTLFWLASPLPISTPQSSSPGPSTPQSSSSGPSTPQSSSPGPSTSQSSSPWTLSNNQNPRIPYEDLQEAATLSKNPELVDVFFTYNGQLLDLYELLKKIVEPMSKGGTFTSCRRDVLATSMASFEQMGDKVMVVLVNQRHMLESQKRYGATLDVEVHVKNCRKDDYYTICASLAALSGASVFFAVKLYPKSLSLSLAVVFAVFAAIASALFYRAARRTDTYQDQLMVPVKKRKDIIEVIIRDNKLALYHLASMKALINDLQSQVEPILKMVDSGVAMGSNVLEAFNLGFQKLVSEVDQCSMDAYSSRQGVVQTINKNLH